MDALAPLGIRHLDMPLTPDKIWKALERVGKRKTAKVEYFGGD